MTDATNNHSRSTRALIHHVKQKDSLLPGSVLELLEIFALLRGSTPNLKERNPVGSKSFRNLFHQVWELNKEKQALRLRDLISGAWVSVWYISQYAR